MDAIEHVRSAVRSVVRQVARGLNAASRSNITPNMVTIAGVLLHFVIIWLILNDLFVLAGLSLIIFGLFDTLDGELARLQHRVSDFGMVLDATTDRIKEGMLLGTIGYWFARDGRLSMLALSLSVLIISFAISYIKAKAETTVADGKADTATLNRRYQDGIARFEIRMTLIVIALLTGWLAAMLWLLLVISLWTLTERAVRISNDIRHDSN